MLGSYLAFKKNMPPKFKILAFILNAMIKSAKRPFFVVVRGDWQGRRENVEGIDSTGH
jgi:hypothetical protein